MFPANRSLLVLCLITATAGCSQESAFQGVFDTTLLGQPASAHLVEKACTVSGHVEFGESKLDVQAQVDPEGKRASGTLVTLFGPMKFVATARDRDTIDLKYEPVGLLPGATLVLKRRPGATVK